MDGLLPAVDETLTIAGAVASRRCGKRGADRSDVAHDVQLPVGVPFVVSDVLESRLARDAGVVHQQLEPTEGGGRLVDGPFGLSRDLQVARHMQRLADAGRSPSAAGHDASTLLDELCRDRTADAARRTGDEARSPCESQIHGELAYRP